MVSSSTTDEVDGFEDVSESDELDDECCVGEEGVVVSDGVDGRHGIEIGRSTGDALVAVVVALVVADEEGGEQAWDSSDGGGGGV